MKNLYNPDGTLSVEAQSLISPKPDDMSRAEWRNKMKLFKISLSREDLEEFKRLRTNYINSVYYDRHPEKVKARSRIRVRDDRLREKERERQRKWYALHYKKINKSTTQRQNRLYREDSLYKLKKAMRSQCYRTVKLLALDKKPSKTFEWVGCTPEQLKAHFESLFIEGMSWENYGKWHVDHIRPISSFKAEEWEQINHYTNLQPLWANDNFAKGDKWI